MRQNKPKSVTATEADHGGRVFYVEDGKVYEGRIKESGVISEQCEGCDLRENCKGEEIRMDACYHGFNDLRGNRTLHLVRAIS